MVVDVALVVVVDVVVVVVVDDAWEATLGTTTPTSRTAATKTRFNTRYLTADRARVVETAHSTLGVVVDPRGARRLSLRNRVRSHYLVLADEGFDAGPAPAAESARTTTR